MLFRHSLSPRYFLLTLGLVASVPAVWADAGRPVVLAHYMPWFEAKPRHGWGWHWTMGRLNPDHVVEGRAEAASHFRPRIGLYDTSDPDVRECQVLQMKFSGIDGVLVDWYGIDPLFDYAANHANTEAMLATIERAGMKFGVVYEDQTVRQLIDHGVYPESAAVTRGAATLKWLSDHWFARDAYLKWQGRPVFLVFGPQYFKNGEWSQLFSGLPSAPAFYTLANRQTPAVGAFNWPAPQRGEAASWAEIDRFARDAKGWPSQIAVAYSRFQDFYAEAQVHPSWGAISDANGTTYTRTLQRALASGAPLVQIATWNDWGEGTQIEPSVEFGYRDLEATQRAIRPRRPDGHPYESADLRLPERLYRLRKRTPAVDRASLDRIASALFRGEIGRAERAIAKAGG